MSRSLPVALAELPSLNTVEFAQKSESFLFRVPHLLLKNEK